MQIDIQTIGFDLTPTLRAHIENKIGGIEKFLRKFDKSSIHARVRLERLTQRHRHGNVFHAQINLHAPGMTLLAEHNDENIWKAIREARRKLKREIRKNKVR